MALEDLQVGDAVLDELGTDQLAAGVPAGAVGGEDAVAEELLPLAVKGLALAVVAELRGQHGLDVLGVVGEDDAPAEDAELGRVAADGVEDVLPQLAVLLARHRPRGLGGEVDAPGPAAAELDGADTTRTAQPALLCGAADDVDDKEPADGPQQHGQPREPVPGVPKQAHGVVRCSEGVVRV